MHTDSTGTVHVVGANAGRTSTIRERAERHERKDNDKHGYGQAQVSTLAKAHSQGRERVVRRRGFKIWANRQLQSSPHHLRACAGRTCCQSCG